MTTFRSEIRSMRGRRESPPVLLGLTKVKMMTFSHAKLRTPTIGTDEGLPKILQKSSDFLSRADQFNK